MVHISDGVLPPAMLAAGFLFTIILLILSMRGMMMEEIPKISLITAALFVASLVHFLWPDICAPDHEWPCGHTAGTEGLCRCL